MFTLWYTTFVSGVLEITNVQQADAGKYKCTVDNGKEEKTSSAVELKVEAAGSDVVKPLQMMTPVKQNLTVKVGEKVDLQCSVAGLPPPTLTWTLQGGTHVKSNNLISTIGQGTLHIASASLDQSGKYICSATNSDPNSETLVSFIILRVVEPPKIQPLADISRHLEGSSLRIPCVATGTPRPSIYWLKNGAYDGYPTSRATVGTNLTMHHVSIADSGYYQCIAVNSAGNAQGSMYLNLTASPNSPSTPQGLTVKHVNSTSILLQWKHSTVKKGDTLVAYSVHYLPIGGDGVELQAVVQKNTSLLKDLSPFTNYTIYLIAYAGKSTSDHSETIFVVTGESLPSTAPRCHVTALGLSSLKVTWGVLTQDEAKGVISNIRVYYRKAGYSNIDFHDVSPNDSEFVITGLESRQRYEVRVLAGTQAGYPKLSDGQWPWCSATTQSPNNGVPEIADLRARHVTNTSVELEWEMKHEPVTNFIGFRLEWNIVGERRKHTLLQNHQRDHVLTKLEEEKTYQIALTAISKMGDGEPFSIEISTHNSGSPSMPSPPMPPHSASAHPLNSTAIQVTWKSSVSPDVPVIGYTVLYSPVDKQDMPNTVPTVHTINSTGTEVIIGGLKPFSTYEFRIQAHAEAVSGSLGDHFLCATRQGFPTAPGDLKADEDFPKYVKLSWQPPMKTNGIITTYEILYTEGGSALQSWHTIVTNDTKNYFQLTGLQGKAYLFKVQARTEAGAGPASAMLFLDLSFMSSSSDGEATARLGIIIGICIGIFCIIISILIILMRNRCCPPQQTPPPTLTRPYENGTGLRCNGHLASNGYIGSGHDVTTRLSIGDDSFSPMLPSYQENKNSDTKGGYYQKGTTNGFIRVSQPLNGLKVTYKPNGNVSTSISDNSPEVPVRNESLQPMLSGHPLEDIDHDDNKDQETLASLQGPIIPGHLTLLQLQQRQHQQLQNGITPPPVPPHQNVSPPPVPPHRTQETSQHGSHASQPPRAALTSNGNAVQNDNSSSVQPPAQNNGPTVSLSQAVAQPDRINGFGSPLAPLGQYRRIRNNSVSDSVATGSSSSISSKSRSQGNYTISDNEYDLSSHPRLSGSSGSTEQMPNGHGGKHLPNSRDCFSGTSSLVPHSVPQELNSRNLRTAHSIAT